jgi:hypothetical protein
MHPTALAKRTKQSNDAMLIEIQALADLLGCSDITTPLYQIKPSIRRPAESALKQREAMVGVFQRLRINAAEQMAESRAASVRESDEPSAAPAADQRRRRSRSASESRDAGDEGSDA